MSWAKGSGLRGSFEDVCASADAKAHVLSELKAVGKAGGLNGVQVVHSVFLEPKVRSVTRHVSQNGDKCDER